MAQQARGDNTLQDLFRASGRHLVCRKGQILLKPGEVPRGVYLAESGLIKVYSRSKNGTEHDHLFYGEDDIFPIIWTVEGTFRNVYYEALEETSLWLLDRKTFLDFVQNRADVSFQLLERTTELFKLYAARIDNLLYSDASERIAFRLLALLNRYRIESPDGQILDIPLTNQDIARSVATTRETVNRVLARFKRRGILDYNADHRIVVHDIEGLIKIIGYETAAAMWPELVA